MWTKVKFYQIYFSCTYQYYLYYHIDIKMFLYSDMSDLVTIYFLRTALFDLLMCYLKYCHLCLNVRLTWHLSLVFSPRAEPDIKICMCVCSVTQSYLTLCPLWTVAPGSSVQGIFQGRMLEWVAISSSRGSFWPRDQTYISYTGRWILYYWATWEAHIKIYSSSKEIRYATFLLVCDFISYLIFINIFRFCFSLSLYKFLFIYFALKLLAILTYNYSMHYLVITFTCLEIVYLIIL